MITGICGGGVEAEEMGNLGTLPAIYHTECTYNDSSFLPM